MSVYQISLNDIRERQHRAFESGDRRALRECRGMLEQWLTGQPKNWAVMFYLGANYLAENRHAIARLIFEEAVRLNPNAGEAYNNIGICHRAGHHVDLAREAFTRSAELQPNDPTTWNNLATLCVNEGCPEDGLGYLAKSLELHPGQREAHWNRALCLLEMERWGEGWDEYSWGMVTKDRLCKTFGRAEWWQGQFDKERSIVVYGEQGIGDEIMFASQIKGLKGKFKEVIIDCHPRLVTLFKSSFDWATVYGTRKEIHDEPAWVAEHAPKWKAPMGMLGKHLTRREADFARTPYLRVPTKYVAAAKARLHTAAPLIGISWVGGYQKTRKDLRHVPLDQWRPIFEAGKAAGAEFVSMQYTGHEEQAKAAAEAFGVTIHLLPEIVESKKWERYYPLDADGMRIKDDKGEDYWTNEKLVAKDISLQHGGSGKLDFKPPRNGFNYAQTAGLVRHIGETGGVIVSINTSLVHLCGAMGQKALVLTPSRPAWRYGLARTDMIWYSKDSIRQFRQLEGEEWTVPISRVATAVAEHFSPTARDG